MCNELHKLGMLSKRSINHALVYYSVEHSSKKKTKVDRLYGQYNKFIRVSDSDLIMPESNYKS